MDQVLCAVPSTYIYIDDVLIASATPEEHLQDLQTVFECPHMALSSTPICASLVSMNLDFLSHHIDKQGITPLPEKVQAIRDFLQPQFQRQLRQFIELVNFIILFSLTVLI